MKASESEDRVEVDDDGPWMRARIKEVDEGR